jgi:Domain of unknown function (DUF4845)
MSIITLMVLGVIAGFLIMVGLKVFPTVNELLTIRRLVDKAAAAGGSVTEIQSTFDRGAQIDTVSSIQGRDLVISREGDKTVVSFAYEKKIELFGPASLLLEYKGSSKK